MDYKFKYTELAPPVPPRSEWPKRFRQDPMTENTEVKGPRAGNTVATLQPLTRDHIEYRQMDVPSVLDAAPQPSMNCPDIDECAPVFKCGAGFGLARQFRYGQICRANPPGSIQEALEKFEAERAAQIPEEIPPTNLWSLRWRINELEKRVDELTDRIALFNVRSGQKL